MHLVSSSQHSKETINPTYISAAFSKVLIPKHVNTNVETSFLKKKI